MADMRRMEARMGPSTRSTVCDGGARHGFAVRTHPGYAEDAAKQSFDEAKRFLTRRSQENLMSAVQTRPAHHFFDRQIESLLSR
jgi:hypothetical protein